MVIETNLHLRKFPNSYGSNEVCETHRVGAQPSAIRGFHLFSSLSSIVLLDLKVIALGKRIVFSPPSLSRGSWQWISGGGGAEYGVGDGGVGGDG